MISINIDAKQYKQFIHLNKPTTFLLLSSEKSPKSIELKGSFRKNCENIWRLNQEGYNAYMTVHTMAGNVRSSDNAVMVNALFIDYDKGDWSADDIDQFMSKFKVKPHMVVETSPGNFHVYWRVQSVPLAQLKPIQQELAAMFNSDPVVCDLARVMRIPGTINHNHETQFVARIVYFNNDVAPIELEDFKSGMFGTSSARHALIQHNGNKPAKATALTVSKADDDGEAGRTERALQVIPADDRKVWITVGMALHSHFGDDGIEMFKAWSSKSSKYDEAELERQWRSFKPNGKVKIGTVFHLAKLHGLKQAINNEGAPVPSNMLQLAKHFGVTTNNGLRYCEAEDTWYVFKNGLWEKSLRSAERIAIEFLQSVLVWALDTKDDRFIALMQASQSVSRAKELLSCAASDPLLAISDEAFDQSPYIIGAKLPDIPGGITRFIAISLDRRATKHALPEHMLRTVVGAEYDPSATSPLWEQFLEQVTAGDEDLIEFLQLAVGYTLYGHTKEQVMFVVIGGSGTGKGTFIRIIFKLLGKYSTVMQSSLLKVGALNGNGPSPALMKLKGKRLWWCSEIRKGMAIDEGFTKQITGGDIVSGRAMYADQAEFSPVGKLWFTVNDMPRIRYEDDGMWRRIIPIPFNVSFQGKNCDADLEDKLLAELPGILNWALAGARKYAKKGKLGRPKASLKLVRALRRSEDTVGLWIDSRCKITAIGKLQSSVAYQDYSEAVKREKLTPLPQKEFKAELTHRGYPPQAWKPL